MCDPTRGLAKTIGDGKKIIVENLFSNLDSDL